VPRDELMFRVGTSADAPRCAALLIEGFETYRAFAPPNWTAPTIEEETANLVSRLDRPEVWAMLAEQGPELAGYVAIMPAAASYRAVPDPGLAHFWQLFVRPPWWGSGLATRLHTESIAAARGRGYTAIRLFTPAGHERARRLYEREGWSRFTAPFFDDRIGLDVVEYRAALTHRPSDRVGDRLGGA
jgi:diamine N-acetyltransferase